MPHNFAPFELQPQIEHDYEIYHYAGKVNISISNSQHINSVVSLHDTLFIVSNSSCQSNFKSWKELRIARDRISRFDFSILNIHASMLCRLEDECLKRKGKLKIRLKSDVNLITFNSSFFSGSSLHCHLGKTSSDLSCQNILIAYMP